MSKNPGHVQIAGRYHASSNPHDGARGRVLQVPVEETFRRRVRKQASSTWGSPRDVSDKRAVRHCRHVEAMSDFRYPDARTPAPVAVVPVADARVALA